MNDPGDVSAEIVKTMFTHRWERGILLSFFVNSEFYWTKISLETSWKNKFGTMVLEARWLNFLKVIWFPVGALMALRQESCECDFCRL